MTYRFHAGNSMVEYALPLGIFFVAGLAVLITTDVPTRLADFFSDSMNGSSNGGTVAIAPYGSPIGGVNGTADNWPTGGNAGQGDTDSGVGTTATASGDGSTVETTGGLGNDDTPVADSSDALGDLADDLEDSNADPALVALINDLANSGHDLATAQADMPRWGDINTGEVQDVYNAFLAIKGDTSTPGMIDTFKEKLTALNDFLANNAGALTAEQQQLLQNEADNIIAIIDSLEYDTSGINVDARGIDPFGYGEGDVSVDGGVAVTGGDAEGTEGSSNNACAQGGSNCTQDSSGDGTTTGGNDGGGG